MRQLQQSSNNDQFDHLNEDQMYPPKRSAPNPEMERLKRVIAALICFILVAVFILLYREFDTREAFQDGKFYREELLSYELDEFWKMTEEEIQEEQEEKDSRIIKKGEHIITRQQLGHNSWSFLHMVTGSFPDEISPVLVEKFNAFLLLFGQMYPCKLCANHFMGLLREVGPFEGNTKEGLMTYLCQIHNRVNKRLGKEEHSCTNVVEEWNSCGCSSEL